MRDKHLFADIPAKALIINDGKVLIMLGADDDNWQLPGGRVNEGETLGAALKREIKEELNLVVEPENIFDAFLFTSASGTNHMVIIYRCKILSDLNNIKFNDGETNNIRWVAAKDIGNLKMRHGYRNTLLKYFAFEPLLLKRTKRRSAAR